VRVAYQAVNLSEIMGREIQLDGTEISIIKALGIGGGEIDGETLIERCQDLEIAELIDTVRGLMSLGYVDADSNSFYNKKEMVDINFRVNSGYSKDLKEALDPRPQQRQSKRIRRE
jgi:hypothetical protein